MYGRHGDHLLVLSHGLKAQGSFRGGPGWRQGRILWHLQGLRCYRHVRGGKLTDCPCQWSRILCGESVSGRHEAPSEVGRTVWTYRRAPAFDTRPTWDGTVAAKFEPGTRGKVNCICGSFIARYLRHSAQERRVAPRLRFLTSPTGGLLRGLSAPLKDASGEDMTGRGEMDAGRGRRTREECGLLYCMALRFLVTSGIRHSPPLIMLVDWHPRGSLFHLHPNDYTTGRTSQNECEWMVDGLQMLTNACDNAK